MWFDRFWLGFGGNFSTVAHEQRTLELIPEDGSGQRLSRTSKTRAGLLGTLTQTGRGIVDGHCGFEAQLSVGIEWHLVASRMTNWFAPRKTNLGSYVAAVR